MMFFKASVFGVTNKRILTSLFIISSISFTSLMGAEEWSGFKSSGDFPVGTQPRGVTSGDFNADGFPDLATANFGLADISVLLGQGNGAFASSVNYPTGENPRSIRTAYVNGDNIIDITTANTGGFGNVSYLIGIGDGTFGVSTNYIGGVITHNVTRGDFNGDGRMDVASAIEDEDLIRIALVNNSFSYDFTNIAITGRRPITVTTADFNGDGFLDLATANFESFDVSIFLGNGDGTFGFERNFAAATGPSSIIPEDFNRDGYVDLAVANNLSDNVSVLLGIGDGTFVSPVNYGVGFGPDCIAVADFNSDGFQDLVTANRLSDSVTVLLNQGISLPSPSTFSFTPEEQQSPALAWSFVVPTEFDGTISGTFDDVNERLAAVTSTNTGAFGFWESPEFTVADSASKVTRGLFLRGEVGEDSLFRASWTLSSDGAVDQENLPIVRLRAGSRSFSITSEIISSSRGNGDFSPAADGGSYHQYFALPAEDNVFGLSFDVLNFDPMDAAVASLFLEDITLESIGRNVLGSPTEVANFDFAGQDNGFTARNAGPDLSVPKTFTIKEGGLLIRGLEASPARTTNNDVIFGYWGAETEIPFTGGKLYRVAWTVASDEAEGNALQVPTFRLRVNDSSLKFASLLHVNSYNETARVPTAGSSQQYDLWFVAPDQIDGSSWYLSFDYLVVGGVGRSVDDPTIGLFLEDINVEEYALE